MHARRICQDAAVFTHLSLHAFCYVKALFMLVFWSIVSRWLGGVDFLLSLKLYIHMSICYTCYTITYRHIHLHTYICLFMARYIFTVHIPRQKTDI